MKVTVWSAQSCDRQFLLEANTHIGHELVFFDSHLCEKTHLSDQVLKDDVFGRLLTFPNVLITRHRGFFTAEALSSVAQTTLQGIGVFERDGICQNEVTVELLRAG